MPTVAIVYSTVDGQTLRICQRLAAAMEALGQRCELIEVGQAAARPLDQFDKLVVGASIRYGHHRPAVAEFVRQCRGLLETRPSAFFSVNIVARKPHKGQADTNPYLLRFLREVNWRPAAAEVFAGRLDFARYRWIDRQMIRLIMWLTGGPTAADTRIEYTDWDRVDQFAKRLAAL